MKWLWIPLALILVLVFAVACGGDEEEEATPTTAPATTAPATATPAQMAPTATPAHVATVTLAKPTTVATKVVPTPSGDQPKFGGTLRAVPLSTIPSVDPQLSPSRMCTGVLWAALEAPFAFDDDWNIRPLIVDTWETSSDGLTWTFKIRSGLEFHNGEPVTAEDVVGSWARSAEGKAPMPKLVNDSFVESIDAIDATTFKMVLSGPTGLVLNSLTAVLGGRSPRVSAKAQWSLPVSEFANEHTGTGPFKFVSWDQGNRVVQERWEGYDAQKLSEPPSFTAGGHTAYFDRIEWLEIPDPATRISALVAGEIEWLDDFSADFRKNVEDGPLTTVVSSQSVRQVIVWPNLDHPPFDSFTARQAVMAGLNNEDILEATFGGSKDENWTTCPSLYGCGFMTSPFSNDTGSQGLYNQNNIAAARKIMEDGGLMGTQIKVHSPEGHWLGTLVKVLEQNLREIGFDTEYIATDWPSLSSKIYRSEPQAWDISGNGSQMSGDFHPVQYASRVLNNSNNYTDPSGRMEKLFYDLPRASTQAEQIAISSQIQEVYYEELPFFLLGYQAPIFGWNKDLRGLKPVSTPYFPDVWLDR